MSVRDTAMLLDIANRAIDAHDANNAYRAASMALADAYAAFKESSGIDSYIDRGSPEWLTMMVATKDEHEACKAAKRAAYNAERRLETAIRRFQGHVALMIAEANEIFGAEAARQLAAAFKTGETS